jgi:DNA polymerase-3 subunit delta'
MLAQAWLCQSPSQDGADGTCRACGAFARGMSADFLHIFPTGASSIIRVHAIVQGDAKDAPVPLLEFFRTAPLMAKHKVAMIEQAHRMNSEAYNALLKTLEEPHEYVRLVLTTDSISSVPATILSRCLAVACELPGPEEISRLFPGATEADLILSEGAPGRVAHVLAHADRYRAIYEFAESLASRPAGGALLAAEQFRSICDGIEKALDCGARTAQAEALETLAIALSRSPKVNPAWSQRVLEAHRRVVGNSGIGLVLDSLFTGILAV